MENKEYIERGALLQKNMYGNTAPITHRTYAEQLISSAPAADVVEVVHGEWILKTDYKTPLSHGYIRKEKLHICPYCAKAYRQKMNFCGNCGAKMDGGSRNADA